MTTSDGIDEAELRAQRPSIGERRSFATGEAIFLAPLPLPTGHDPIDIAESVQAVNDCCLDIGSSGKNMVFLIQVLISLLVVIVLIFVVILPLIAGFGTWYYNLSVPFWQRTLEVVKFGVWSALGGLILLGSLSIYTVRSGMKERAGAYPLRFNRQRQQVCLVDSSLPKPLYVDWEELVVWIAISMGTTGDGITETMNLGMAFDDPEHDKIQFVNWGIFSAAHGMAQWELIRSYMAFTPIHISPAAPPEGRHTLNEELKTLRLEQQMGITGIFGTFCWWAHRILSLWRIPYYLAELEQRYYRVQMPAEVEEWSRPLPKEQWAQPSEKLRQESARIRYAMSQGHSWFDYCHGNVEVPDELPIHCYQEGPLDGRLQPSPDAKRRGKKAAEFKRKAKAHEIARRRKAIELQRERTMKEDEG